MKRFRPDTGKCVAGVFVSLFLVLCSTAPSHGKVTRVVVEASGTMGSFGGREYFWATGAMEGTVNRGGGVTGHYRVPISLMFPDRNPNGFGFVDVVNSADFEIYRDDEAPFGKRKIYYAGDIIFSDYLRREGYIYLSVQWARMVTEVLGAAYGVIEDGRDGYDIVKDASRFLRDPTTLEGALPFPPEPVDRVIAFGQSQTASLLLELVRRGGNRDKDGSLVFDGVLAGVHAGCLVLNNDETGRPGPGPTFPNFGEFVPCDGPLPEDGKFISILSESDLEAFESYRTRHQSANFRQYEIAGVAHIPTDIIGLKFIGAKRQNPVSFRPVFKVTLRNLAEWISSGEEPPASLYLEGTIGEEGSFHYATDADGNVTGGVRLPHLATVLPDGTSVGAPLGVYRGLDSDHRDPLNLYPWIGGTFERFSDAELARRYPTRDAYVELVRKAAAALLSQRFILEEDYEAYVTAAERGW